MKIYIINRICQDKGFPPYSDPFEIAYTDSIEAEYHMTQVMETEVEDLNNSLSGNEDYEYGILGFWVVKYNKSNPSEILEWLTRYSVDRMEVNI